jgi:hypothetical protein
MATVEDIHTRLKDLAKTFRTKSHIPTKLKVRKKIGFSTLTYIIESNIRWTRIETDSFIEFAELIKQTADYPIGEMVFQIGYKEFIKFGNPIPSGKQIWSIEVRIPITITI